MAELLANYSGAGMTISGIPVRYEHVPSVKATEPNGYRRGPYRRAVFADETEMVTLSDLFVDKVLNTPKWAWYVDYYTEDPAKYNVHYLSLEPFVRWTNENRDERDARDLKGSMWSPEEVAEWFTLPADKSTYEHVVKFHSGNHAHRLHIAKFNVTLDGEDRWEAYHEFGIRGAMGEFGEIRSFNHLDGIEVYRA